MNANKPEHKMQFANQAGKYPAEKGKFKITWQNTPHPSTTSLPF
jgi:hypothetical protein